MIIGASQQLIRFLPSFDKVVKQIETSYHQIEGIFNTKLLKLTRDINELSGLILELNDLNLELNLQEFDGLL